MQEKRIVRFMGTDLDGRLPVERALRKIKGIKFMLSKAICISANIDSRKKMGLLSDEELRNLENAIKNPKLPSWLLNRRRDRETGEDLHLVGSQLDLKKMEDISFLKKIRAYRGIRHELGLPVRGQRTRSSFRTQRTVGVSRKKALTAKKESEKSEK